MISFLNDLQYKKFKVSNKHGIANNLELIKNDKRYEETKNWIENKYFVEGYGMKSLIKDFQLPITYSVLRYFLLTVLQIKLRKDTDITDLLRKKRSEKAKKEYRDHTGWGKSEIRDNQKKQKHLVEYKDII